MRFWKKKRRTPRSADLRRTQHDLQAQMVETGWEEKLKAARQHRPEDRL